MDNSLLKLYESTVPDSNGMIPLSLICNVFQIDYDRQYRNIDNDISYKETFFKISNEDIFGDKRKRGHLSKKGFIMWIMQLSTSLIPEEMRTTFIEYKNNIIDYLYDNAIQQENVLKTINTLKKQKNDLYVKLHGESSDFRELIDIQARIMRLGKDNKAIQNKIAGGMQIDLDLSFE